VLNFDTFDLNQTPYETAMIPAETEFYLTKAIAEAIKHVRKFFLTRKSPPTKAEEIGEFVNGLRRQLNGNLEFNRMLDVSMWIDIAVPSSYYTYKWDFIFCATTVNCKMNYAIASTICQGAKVMAQDKNLDEEFREINKVLNDLLLETNVLNTLVYCAKDLNVKAGVVVDNLCSIAEKLETP
jgi:hypothetical protein